MVVNRRYQVFDGDGEVIGAFADFGVAHAWSHERCRTAPSGSTVEIDDRRKRLTWMVSSSSCVLIAWRPLSTVADCPLWAAGG